MATLEEAFAKMTTARFVEYLKKTGNWNTDGVMTQAELIAANRAYAVPISDRTGLVSAFNGWNNPSSWMISKTWRIIANIAIRKSDGFTVTRDELENTEIWS